MDVPSNYFDISDFSGLFKQNIVENLICVLQKSKVKKQEKAKKNDIQ
jgi:hypothetical protein